MVSASTGFLSSMAVVDSACCTMTIFGARDRFWVGFSEAFESIAAFVPRGFLLVLTGCSIVMCHIGSMRHINPSFCDVVNVFSVPFPGLKCAIVRALVLLVPSDLDQENIQTACFVFYSCLKLCYCSPVGHVNQGFEPFSGAIVSDVTCQCQCVTCPL